MTDSKTTPPSPKPKAKPKAPSHHLPPFSRWPRFVTLRRWLRSRTGRIVVPLAAFILGIVLSIGGLLLFGSSGDGQRLQTPVSARGDLIIEADRAFLTHLISMNLRDAGLPGTIQNVQVTLARGDQMTINGDDTFSMLGISISRPFVVIVQPYVTSCVLQIHVVHADLSGIPVTGFAPTFESQINRQLSEKPTGLPEGFNYCATAVRTQPDGMFVTYAAIPVALDRARLVA
jgi:hypothetical protein